MTSLTTVSISVGNDDVANAMADDTSADLPGTAPPDPALLAALMGDGAGEAYRALTEQDRVLDKIARSLERSGRYRVLLHQAWRQPMPEEREAQAILIQAGERSGATYEIEGTLRFHLSRFLHVRTDLWFTDFASQAIAAFATPLAAAGYDAGVQDGEMTQQILPAFSYQLQHSRRMRSATLHYIDHPRFGLLVQINDYAGPVTDPS